jgi:hypothetical protein
MGEEPVQGTEITGKTLGVVGLVHGSEVARKCQAMSMNYRLRSVLNADTPLSSGLTLVVWSRSGSMPTSLPFTFPFGRNSNLVSKGRSLMKEGVRIINAPAGI